MLTRGRVPVLVATVLLAFAGGASPALAGSGGDCVPDGLGGSTCTGQGTSPGGGGNGDSGTANGGICMDSSASVTYNGTTYPCSSSSAPGKWWYVGGGCYSAQAPATDWPPVGDPRWGGHTEADNGIIVYRSCQAPPSIAGSYLTWERCVGNCATFDPADVMARMKLMAPVLQLSPPGGSSGFVHQNVWVWTDTDMVDHTKTETSGANVIVATRHLTEIDWSWGDGTTGKLPRWPLVCRRYLPSDGGDAAPAGCGHAYDVPGPVRNGVAQPYTIKVTAHWTFTYSYNGGPEQTLPEQVLSNTATITIKEGESTNG